MKSKGGFTPKLIIVLSSPSLEEDEVGEIRDIPVLNSCLGDLKDEVYITHAVKCCSYKDTITQVGGTRAASKEEILFCRTILFKELGFFSEDTPVMTLGTVALDAFLDEHDTLSKELGIARNVKIGEKTFKVIPNYHPEAIGRNPSLFHGFKQVIQKVLHGTTQQEHLGDRIKFLNYEQSINYLTKLLEKHRNKEIDYTVFDIESTSLSPFKGKSIMYSFATEDDPVAYSIPLVINNEFEKDNTLAAFKVTPELDQMREVDSLNEQIEILKKAKNNGEEYKATFSKLSALQKQIELELDVKFKDIVKKYLIPFDITPAQASHIDLLTKQVVESIPLVGHNLKFDLMFKMIESGYDLYKVTIKADTMITAHQIQGPHAGSLSLKAIAKSLFNVEDDWDGMINDKIGYLSKYRFLEDRHYGNIPTGILGEYSALDAYWNKFVYKHQLENLHEEQLIILEEVTRATIPFAEAEGKGIFIEQSLYQFIKNEFDTAVSLYLSGMRSVPKIKALIDKNIAPLREKNNSPRKKIKMTEEEMVKDCFSPDSHPDVRMILHSAEFFNLPISKEFMTDGGKTGKKEAQTGEEALTYLLKNHTQENSDESCFIENLIKYKEIKTLKSRLDKIPNGVSEGLYKTDFALTTTKTGRLSSPFHSIPSKSDFKRIFSSRWLDIGGLFVAADQSQLEVRIGASIANETTLIDAYKTGIDVHTQTAAEIFKIPFEEVSGKQRGIAKAINFGILYGKTAHSLGPELGIKKEEAEDFITRWYSNKPNIKRWIPEQIAKVFKDGYVLTPMGRVIYIPETSSKDFGKRKHAENCAINFPIQSSASDVGVRAGNEIAFALKRDKMKSLFLASVHDSLEYDIYPGELFHTIRLIKSEAEDRVREKYDWIKCPLKMDISLGSTWGGALELTIHELTDTQLIATAEGMRKDFLNLKTVGSRAYDVKVNVKQKSIPKPFPIDCVIRDSELWTAEIIIKR